MSFRSKDLWSGIAFIGLGLIFLLLSQNYQMGTARRMGPAFFPTAVAVLLIIVGLITSGRALKVQGEPIDGEGLYSLALISAATVVFALTVKGLGMIPGVFLLTGLCTLASPNRRWGERLVLSAILALGCWLLFTLGLGMPLAGIGPWLKG